MLVDAETSETCSVGSVDCAVVRTGSDSGFAPDGAVSNPDLFNG